MSSGENLIKTTEYPERHTPTEFYKDPWDYRFNKLFALPNKYMNLILKVLANKDSFMEGVLWKADNIGSPPIGSTLEEIEEEPFTAIFSKKFFTKVLELYEYLNDWNEFIAFEVAPVIQLHNTPQYRDPNTGEVRTNVNAFLDAIPEDGAGYDFLVKYKYGPYEFKEAAIEFLNTIESFYYDLERLAKEANPEIDW